MAEEGVTTQEVQVPSLIDEVLPEPAPAADDKKAEPDAPDDKAKPEAETTEQQEQKKQSRFQRRLDAQKSARIAAETETRLLREQNARLEAQLKPPQQDTGEPRRDQFDDYETFLLAATKYAAKQAAGEVIKSDRDAAKGSAAQSKQAETDAKISQKWAESEAEFQKQTADYLEVVTPYVDVEIGHLSEGARHFIVDAGPALLYHMAANPDISDRIATLSPLRQIVELGELEKKVKTPAVKQASSAPAPIKPVGQGRSNVSGFHENMSQSEYEALRKTQGAKWAR